MTDSQSVLIHNKGETTSLVEQSNGDEASNEDVTGRIGSTSSNSATTSKGDSKEQLQNFHPFVHWAQSPTHISLRVDLIQAKKLDVTVSETGSTLSFSAQGRGAQGLQDYRFSIEFYSPVDKHIECHAIERYVLILIKKIDQQIDWPRPTKQRSKFPWLRVDFDRYHAEDSDDSLDNHKANERDLERDKHSYELLRKQIYESEQQRAKLHLQQEINKSWFDRICNINLSTFTRFIGSKKMKHDYRKDTITMDNSKNIARYALDAKKTYLFLYNLVMFITFLKVFIVLLIKGLSGTVDDDIVRGAAFIIKILTYTQLLESIHPILGLVPGGPLMPFTQALGRLIVNLFLSEPGIRSDSAPYAHYLLVVWSSIEIFRYSFYALRVFKVNIYALTWCRYTLFLPLYPMGGLFESMVIFSTIKFYEKTGGYSVVLPNAANISFNLPIALRIYVFILLGPTIYSLMKYMWHQRCKQLKEKVH